MDNKTLNFEFPYTPYPIQIDFMTKLYELMNTGGVSMFQSPTGTGKTMSIICSTLKWLLDYEQYKREHTDKYAINFNNTTEREDLDIKCSNDEPDWLVEQINANQKNVLQNNINKITEILNDIDFHYSLLNQSDIILNNSRHSACTPTQFQCDNSKKPPHITPERVDKHNKHIVKIFYCSRTHSQLDQFVSQFKSSPYYGKVKVVTLGSRQQLCINPKVNIYKSSNVINEKCLRARDLKKCSYISKNLQILTNTILTDAYDIEDLYNLGNTYKLCPYYSNRQAISLAQLVILPYQCIMTASSRDSLNIDLKNNILIIDEAHNLMDIIEASNTSDLSIEQITMTQSIINSYVKEKESSLNYMQLMFLTQLGMFLNAIKTSANATSSYSIEEFLTNSSLENINLVKLDEFIVENQLLRKLFKHSFKLPNINSLENTTFIQTFFNFIFLLKNSSKHDKILVINRNSKIHIKFLCLDLSNCFKDILLACKSVAIVGGTLEPINEFVHFITSCGIPSNKISYNSYDHIVPSTNILPFVIPKSPIESEIKWSYNNWDNKDMLQQIGRSLYNICAIVPSGVVTFVPSYKMLSKLLESLKEEGVFDKINQKKKIIVEEKSDTNTNDILKKYAKYIRINKAALLFAVIGGKLNEGINFSDDLGRCVIIIGMPYPNLNNIEFKTKMDYIKSIHGETYANECYHNICMRAVNQSIGRVIRHKDDYAAILLLDVRYSKPNILSKLPSWIHKHIKIGLSFGNSVINIKQFFRWHLDKHNTSVNNGER